MKKFTALLLFSLAVFTAQAQITNPTATMYPPTAGKYSRDSVTGGAHGNTYNPLLGSPQQVPDYDVQLLISDGWTLINPSAAITAPSNAFLLGSNSAGQLIIPAQNSGTIDANCTTSPGAPQACNPLAVANLMSAVISVNAVAATNITLSGVQTIDGVTLSTGQTVLASSQTSSINNGIYVVQSGAWTRAANFPSGYVISQNCNLSVLVQQGAAYRGFTFWLSTISPITIGTSAQSWAISQIKGTSANYGVVETTDPAIYYKVASVTNPPSSVYDCASFQFGSDGTSLFGDIGDYQGFPCAYADPNGHPINFLESTPTITGTHCTEVANSLDTGGAVTIATAASTCTVTFGGAYTVQAPFCTVSGYSAAVAPYISTAPTTASFSFTTAAAGTVSYNCL